MTTSIVLLRGINVGGHKKVAMAELRDLALQAGLKDVRTVLQSGNMVFGDAGRSSARLEALLEKEAKRRLGLDIHFFVRSVTEWERLVAGNPFRATATADPARLVLMCLKDAPDARTVTTLQASIAGREEIRADGRHAYITYPDGMGRSRLTHAVIEKTLGTRGTARNWNTVLRLAEIAGA